MGDIVEHVARAIYENPTYCDGVLIFWRELPEEKRESVREDARAAIRATLEYLRENPGKAAILSGVDHRLSTTLSGSNTWPDDTAALLRAMLSAALNDIERTG